MNKKKLLILGGGIEQLDAIKMCKKLNVSTIVCDKNNRAPGRKYADKFYNFSIKDLKNNLNIAKKHKVDGIFTLCSEYAVPTVAKIASKLNLRSITPKTAKLATNKIYMKRKLKINNIKTPEFKTIKNKHDYLKFIKNKNFPFVLKPSDSSGQQGIKLIKSDKGIVKKINSVKKISSDKKVLIEKFYNGYELNIVALVESKKVSFLSISHRKTCSENNFGIATEHLFPSKLNKIEIQKLKKLCIKSINAIGLTDGVAYPQVILTNDNKFYLIEIAARIPGGYMREMSLMASGIDPIEFMIYNSLGYKNCILKCANKKKRKSVYIKFFTKLDFKDFKYIKKINGLMRAKKSKGIYNIFFKKIKQIPKLTSSHARFGAVLAYGNNINEAIIYSKRSINKIDFVIE